MLAVALLSSSRISQRFVACQVAAIIEQEKAWDFSIEGNGADAAYAQPESTNLG